MSETKELKFGFKSRRKNVEIEELKFDFPYVEIIPATKKGSVTKFRLLNGAATLLMLDTKDNKVSYFQNDKDYDRFFLGNTTELNDNPSTCKVNLDNSFNSKGLHARICSELKIDNLEEVLYFGIVNVKVEGFEELTTVELIGINEVEIIVDNEEDIKTITNENPGPLHIINKKDDDEMPNV